MSLLGLFDTIWNETFAQALTPSLAVAASRGGALCFEEYRGCRRFDGGAPICASDVFNVGSVTKIITGALLYRLVEEGKLSLDDKVSAYLPCPHFSDVRLVHLLHHTSRLNTAENMPEWPKAPEDSPAYLDALHKLQPKETNLGEAHEYFSPGFSLLMEIIENVSGRSIEDFAQEHFFTPLGMSATHYDVRAVPEKDLVLPYDGEKKRLEQYRVAPPTGDSGLLTNVRDLVRFGELFLGKSSVLNPDTVQTMLRESTGERFWRAGAFCHNGSGNKAGCFGARASAVAVGHPGFTGCHLMIDPACDLVVAITTNCSLFHANWNRYGRICELFYE